MEDPGYVAVARSSEVGAAPFLRVSVRGTELLLARLDDGSVRAFAPRCPHLQQPLTTALLDGGTLECPFHFYAYDLRTGANVFPGDDDDLALVVHDVVERDGEVLVRLSPASGPA